MKTYLISLPLDTTSSDALEEVASIPIDLDGLKAFVKEAQGPGIWILHKEGGDDQALIDALQAFDMGKVEENVIQATVYRLVIGLAETDEDLAATLLDIGADEVQFGPLMRGPLMEARIRSLMRRGIQRARLQYTQARLEEAQQLGNLGNWLYDFQTQQTWWSRQVYTITGLDPDRPAPALEAYLELIHHDDRIFFQTTVEEALARQQGYDIEHRIRRSDGSMRIVHCMSRPVFKDGQMVALSGVIQDVTERRQVEDALRRRDEILSYISNELPAALYQCRLDPDGELWMDYMSPGRMSDLPTVDPGQPILMREVFSHAMAEDRIRLRRSILQSAQTLSPWEDEFRLLDSRGEIHWMLGRSTPARFDDGTIVWYGVVSDITARKRLEEQLHRADRLASIGTLAAGIAHEINNPLAFVLSNLEFAREEAAYLHAQARQADDQVILEDIGQTLETAYEGASRIGAIVQGLMGFARDDAADNTAVDLREVIGAALRIVHNELRKRVELVLDIDYPYLARGNEGQICQVLINLLLNAVQAIPEDRREGNTICVRLREQAPMVVIEIADTGVGIHEETRKRLFDPFFSTKPIGEGTGLGLYVCHNLMDAMEGHLEIESTPGKGTLVRVFLPAGEPAHREVPSVLSSLADESVGRKTRVLVVDDEPELVEAITRSLRSEHDVLGFESPMAALAAVTGGKRFDAVLLDVLMPQMDGVELFEHLMIEQPELKGHIGFLSGGVFDHATHPWPDSIQPPCLTKPFRIQELRQFVQDLLARVPSA
jgi:PAS domain S-box-containing protein